MRTLRALRRLHGKLSAGLQTNPSRFVFIVISLLNGLSRLVEQLEAPSREQILFHLGELETSFRFVLVEYETLSCAVLEVQLEKIAAGLTAIEAYKWFDRPARFLPGEKC